MKHFKTGEVKNLLHE